MAPCLAEQSWLFYITINNTFYREMKYGNAGFILRNCYFSQVYTPPRKAKSQAWYLLFNWFTFHIANRIDSFRWAPPLCNPTTMVSGLECWTWYVPRRAWTYPLITANHSYSNKIYNGHKQRHCIFVWDIDTFTQKCLPPTYWLNSIYCSMYHYEPLYQHFKPTYQHGAPEAPHKG